MLLLSFFVRFFCKVLNAKPYALNCKKKVFDIYVSNLALG